MTESLLCGTSIYRRLHQSGHFTLSRVQFSLGENQSASFPIAMSQESWGRWSEAPEKHRSEVVQRIVDGLAFDPKLGFPHQASISLMSNDERAACIRELAGRKSVENEGITVLLIRPAFYPGETLSERSITIGLLVGFKPGLEKDVLSDYFEDLCNESEHNIVTCYNGTAQAEMALTQMALDYGKDISEVAKLYGLPERHNEVEAWQGVFLALLHDRFRHIIGPYPVESDAGPDEKGVERLH